MKTLNNTPCYMRIVNLKKKINLICKYYGFLHSNIDFILNLLLLLILIVKCFRYYLQYKVDIFYFYAIQYGNKNNVIFQNFVFYLKYYFIWTVKWRLHKIVFQIFFLHILLSTAFYYYIHMYRTIHVSYILQCTME